MNQTPNLTLDELLKQATCAVLIDGQVKGTAWLATHEGHLLTAGHILGEKEPCNKVKVCFVGDEPRQAHKIDWHFEEGMGIDFAILKLTDPPNNRYPLPVSLTKSVEGTFRLRGYGVTLAGQSVGEGRILGTYEPPKAIGNHLFQLRSPEVSERGYSGAAVFSNELQAVVGIQIEATRRSTGAGRNTVLAMPLYRIAQSWSQLSQLKRQVTVNESEIIESILFYLYEQPPGKKVRLSQLQKELALSYREPIIEALYKLKEMQHIDIVMVDKTPIFCSLLSSEGEEARYSESTEQNRSAASAVINEPEDKAIDTYPEFTWTLEGLDPQLVYRVQRQNVIKRIQKILQSPSHPNENRMAFLYGPAQVGKTSLLKELKNILPDEYVCVLIHINGWQSIGQLSTFLHELAANIKSSPEFWEDDYQIEPFRASSKSEATIEFSRFMNQLIRNVRAQGKFLLLMFDELEYLTHKDTDSRIFEYLTGCIESYLDQEVRFVFAGSGNMLNLIQSGSSARFWGKGERVKIGCFERDTSQELVIALTACYFQFDTKAVKRMIALGNGHPHLLRRTLPILVDYWKNRWRKKIVTENDLNDVLKEICIKLSPELRDIWSRLSSLQQEVLRRIARIRSICFRIDHVTIGSEPKIERCLEQLVRLQILDDVEPDHSYTVRLGFVIEALSYDLLS